MTNDIESYKKSLKRYKKLCDDDPDVIREMKELIDDYIASRNVVYSNKAGGALLRKYKRFGEVCGDMASSVFGILLREHLDSKGWADPVPEKGTKAYNRRYS